MLNQFFVWLANTAKRERSTAERKGLIEVRTVFKCLPFLYSKKEKL